jgi:hypothetical protein
MKNRTPRNYRGIENPVKRMADLLPDWLTELGRKGGREDIFSFWLQLMGTQAALTEPVSFADGVLTVKVKSSTLYSLLCQHERPRLLAQLQKKFPVRNLVFRAG